MKKHLAIVGSGISGMICAHYLKDIYNITIFEKNDYLGGHTHTHNLEENGKKFTLDTGFIVFNLKTYPTLIQLFKELEVKKKKSNMSFSVYNMEENLQYSGSGLSGLFAQKRNLFSPKFYRLLLDLYKFFKFALKDYKHLNNNEETIKEYCIRRGLSDYFRDNYLIPMSSAVWSTPHEKVNNFPISLLLPFFFNHGLLRATKSFEWYTVVGGSNSYTKKIAENKNLDIHLNEPVNLVKEKNGSVYLKTNKRNYHFDSVIMACHSDESIKIVKNLSKEKIDLLNKYKYNSNIAVLHTDSRIMPPNRKIWSSWNHILNKKINGHVETTTVYWLNKLQNPDTKTNYFLSINPFQKIDNKKIIKTIKYKHPLFTTENFSLQKNLSILNQDTKIYFAGAYFKFGFHEDGAKAGFEVVKLLKEGI